MAKNGRLRRPKVAGRVRRARDGQEKHLQCVGVGSHAAFYAPEKRCFGALKPAAEFMDTTGDGLRVAYPAAPHGSTPIRAIAPDAARPNAVIEHTAMRGFLLQL